MSDLTGKKIAIIATSHFEEAELVTPRDELSKAGAEVKIYSTDTDPIQAVEGDTEPTQKIDVDGTFGDLDVSAVDAVEHADGDDGSTPLVGGVVQTAPALHDHRA